MHISEAASLIRKNAKRRASGRRQWNLACGDKVDEESGLTRPIQMRTRKCMPGCRCTGELEEPVSCLDQFALRTAYRYSSTCGLPVWVPQSRDDLQLMQGRMFSFKPAGDGNSWSITKSTLARENDEYKMPRQGYANDISLMRHIGKDDAQVEVSLQKPFVFYGKSYTSMRIDSNGYLVFNCWAWSCGWSTGDASLLNHFYWWRGSKVFSAFFTDLNPSKGGSITAEHVTKTAGASPHPVIESSIICRIPHNQCVAVHVEHMRVQKFKPLL